MPTTGGAQLILKVVEAAGAEAGLGQGRLLGKQLGYFGDRRARAFWGIAPATGWARLTPARNVSGSATEGRVPPARASPRRISLDVDEHQGGVVAFEHASNVVGRAVGAVGAGALPVTIFVIGEGFLVDLYTPTRPVGPQL